MNRYTWPPRVVRSHEKNLDRLAEAVGNNSQRNDDEQIWLTRFLVVRACGYLEQVVHEITIGYLNEKAGGPVQAFSLSWLSKSRNPSPSNLLEIIGRFDETWRAEFEMLLSADGGRLETDLLTLVARRHQIAHGLNEGMGTQKALALVEVAKNVAEWFIRRFDPSPPLQRR